MIGTRKVARRKKRYIRLLFNRSSSCVSIHFCTHFPRHFQLIIFRVWKLDILYNFPWQTKFMFVIIGSQDRVKRRPMPLVCMFFAFVFFTIFHFFWSFFPSIYQRKKRVGVRKTPKPTITPTSPAHMEDRSATSTLQMSITGMMQ